MKCPRCGKPIDGKNCSCIYCGATIIQRHQDSDMNERLEKAQKIEYALLREIRQAFPDEIIDFTQWNHSRWDKPTAFVCRELGYKSVHSFLESHGLLVLSLQQNPYEDSYADSPIINNEHSRVRNNPPPVKRKKAEAASRRVLPVMILCSIVLLFVLAAFLFVKIIGSSKEKPSDIQMNVETFSGIKTPTVGSENLADKGPENDYSKVLLDYADFSRGLRRYDEYVKSSTWSTSMAFIPMDIQGISTLCRFDSNLGYQLIDIDQNGTTELLIGSMENTGSIVADNLVFDMYTLSDGQPERVFVSGERYRFTPLKNQRFYYEDSDGAAIYSFKSGKLKHVKDCSPGSLDENDVLQLSLTSIHNMDDPSSTRNSYHPENYLDQLTDVSVGDTISFGYYEQDNNRTNGKEPIEWSVLTIEDDMALVISKDVLDWQPFHTANMIITWEDSYLREWLNNGFLNNAFTEEEIARIPTVLVPAGQEIYVNYFAGNDTYDKVFVLSSVEAEEYFYLNDSRTCRWSTYAKVRSTLTLSQKSGVGWWLRNPCNSPGYQPAVEDDGSIHQPGYGFESKTIFVRPAMWIRTS